MNPNDELDELRRVARTLRAEPDDDALARLRANVARRTRSRASEARPPGSPDLAVVDSIANLFRPVALTLVTLLLIFGAILVQQQQNAGDIDLIARITALSFDGEELYR